MTFGATVTGAVNGQIWSAWLHVLGKVFRYIDVTRTSIFLCYLYDFP